VPAVSLSPALGDVNLTPAFTSGDRAARSARGSSIRVIVRDCDSSEWRSGSGVARKASVEGWVVAAVR